MRKMLDVKRKVKYTSGMERMKNKEERKKRLRINHFKERERTGEGRLGKGKVQCELASWVGLRRCGSRSHSTRDGSDSRFFRSGKCRNLVQCASRYSFLNRFSSSIVMAPIEFKGRVQGLRTKGQGPKTRGRGSKERGKGIGSKKWDRHRLIYKMTVRRSGTPVVVR